MNRLKMIVTLAMVLIMAVAVTGYAGKGVAEVAQAKDRSDIPDKYKWNLADIFEDWAAWEEAYKKLDEGIDVTAKMKGTLKDGPENVLKLFKHQDEMGQLSYKVYFYPSLMLDENQKNNDINARKQQVMALFAKESAATAWINPELLEIPLATMQQWMDQNEDLAVYRFAIEDLYRMQEHVLDADGEQILSYSSRLQSAPNDIYSMLSTADIDYPTVTMSDGEEIKLSYGTYYKILTENRNQADRKMTFEEFMKTYTANINTYAAIYHGVGQRAWFTAQARKYGSTIEAALEGNNIPVSVVDNLIKTTREGTEPLQKYYALRKKLLNLDTIDLYDGSVPLVDIDKKYDYETAMKWIIDSVKPLGKEYQKRVEEAFDSRWLDVYENEGKRSGAYSAPVYGVHPYMLINYTDTMNDMFTVAHEMGHTMHTDLSHKNQPFVYAGYTIFVAEVPSTLNEALLLDYLLEKTKDPKERILLLQHAIDSIMGTFYTQVMFADFERQALQKIEQGQPITSEVLNGIYSELLDAYFGDVIEHNELYNSTWARIGHFFRTPYYVYQYATCFASSAKLMDDIRSDDKKVRKAALARYMELLKSGGNDHPMEQLKKAGVDLSTPDPVNAVIERAGSLVDQLEKEIEKL